MSMEKRMEDIKDLALSLGLDPFPVVFEVVEEVTMHNVCAYGLPTRARHWSYGRSYDHQKTYGEMGLSKVYEIITNNNPSYAFMLDTNSDVQNLFIAGHCYGHSDFFKNNCMFKNTNRNMIRHAADHAGRVETYIERYGFDKVERIMDIGMALDSHIDWYKGLYRKPYPKRSVITRRVRRGEFDDLLEKKQKPTIIREVTNNEFPPHPEKDLLWFMINYAPLDDWEKDVLDIIREEAYYFYPQMVTKIINEGWASFWHAEIMFKYDDLTPQEHLDFCRDHERVVQPGGNPFRINPYFLGFSIFKDIEKRWDKMHKEGKSDITGRQKIFEVRKNEDDISFVRNYLTADLIEDLNLFTFGYVEEYEKDYEGERFIEIKERMRDEVVESLVGPLYNGGSPKIVITGVGAEGALILRHDSEEVGTLDFKYAEKTLEYIWDLWTNPIELSTKNDEGEDISLCFDEAGFYMKDGELDFGIVDDSEDEEPMIVQP